MDILEEDCHCTPGQEPNNGHEPSGACESIENESISVGPEANLVQRSPEEGAEGEASPLSHDEVRRECCSPTDPNDARVRTVLLRVHEEGERDAHDHTPDENQVEKVRLMSEGVTKVPDDGHGAAEVDWNFVKP